MSIDINYAVVSAFERSKEVENKPVTTRLFTVLLMAVFFIALMAGLAGGAVMYRSISATQADNNDIHLQAGLIANTVHANDEMYAVEEGEGPEGRALVLIESLDSGAYETRLYEYHGHVMQEYAVAGRPYNPTNATVLFESDTFEFSFDGKLLTITTDKGSCDIALRSRQGGSL